MGEMDDKGRELLAKTAQLFMRFGIKSMTMDDVARQLGVSKKTLYQYVTDKNDLVVKAVQLIVDTEVARAEERFRTTPNAIDLLFKVSHDISQKFGQVHPSINYDLEKYHPEAWAIYKGFKDEFLTGCVEQNICAGVEQGLYRDNLDPFLIAKFYSSKMHMCSDGETFDPSKYSFQKIHLEMMRYHIRGIASEKGIKYLQEKVKQENIDL